MAPGSKVQPSAAQLWAFVGALALITSSLGLLNDLMDEETDRITAPNGALISGILTRKESWTAVVLASAASLATSWHLSRSWKVFGYLFLLAAGAWVIMLAYSRLKGKGAVASIVVSTVWPLGAFAGWLLGSRAWSIVLVAIYAYLVGFSDNIFSGIRDIETDPQAGVYTLPARIGAVDAFRVAAVFDFACFGVIASLWALTANHWQRAAGLVIAAVACAVMIVHYRAISAAMETCAERSVRIRQMRPWTRAACLREVGFVAVCAPAAGLALGLTVFLVQWFAWIGSGSRLAGGAIKRALNELSEDAGLKSS
jgi:4-hydroxybenzoate polyprenyltransferase